MGYKTTSTKISSAKTTRSRQTTTYQNPTAAGVVVTGKAVTADTSIFLDVTSPGSARTITAATGGSGATITSITYLDADNLPTNANAVSTTGGNILIVGTGFTSNSRVFVNNVQVTNTYINSSAIRATLSSNVSGNVGLYLFSSANTGGAISGNSVRFSGAPVWVTGTSVTSYNNLASNILLEATGDSTLTYSLKSGSGSLPNGISLLSTGYLTGTATGYTVDTTVQFTLIVTDSENQATQQTFNYSVLLGDTYFNQTTLLLNADQGNTFVTDSSTNNFQVNVVGGAGPSRFTPFSANGYSAYFDGTGDYLQSPRTPFAYTTTSWTIEGYFYFNSTASTIGVMSSPDLLEFTYASGAFNIQYRNNPASAVWTGLTPTYAVSTGQWYHIALVQNSSTLSLYVGGNLVSSTSGVSTGAPGATASNNFWIGANDNFPFGGPDTYFNGLISNFRISNSSLYTANFTPSTTALSTVANTSLLTLRDSVLADDSPNNFTITRNGDVKLVQFSPFNAYTLTPNSYSVYFDGSTDYLNVTDSTGIGAWTVEFWIYLFSAPASNTPIISQGAADNSGGWLMYMNTSRILFMYSNTNLCTANTAVPLNEWSHVAYVSDSNNNLKIFVNGIDVGTGSYTSKTFSNTPITLNRGYGGVLNGMSMALSNFRLVKGTAVYTANFTPSTTALTAIANTSILTCQSTTIIDSNTTPKTITINGNPNVSAANPFYETVTAINNYSYDSTTYGSSAYFDGTGDYLFVNSAANSNLSFGTNNFTIESWVYPQTRTNVGLVQISNVTGGLYNGTINTTALAIVSNKAAVRANGTTYTSTSSDIQANAWTHFALVRSENVSRLYVNGRLDTTLGTSGNISDATNYTGSNVVIGGYATTSFLANGYMSDLRIVKGNAIYTGTSFIPPTSPLTAVANTSLLTLQNSLGANSAQFIDESINSHVVTRVGNAAQGSFSPLVPASWSAYFDGTGDYLSIENNSAFAPAALDFTIEAWVYINALTAGNQTIFGQADSAGSVASGIYFYACNATGFPQLASPYGGSNNLLTSTTAIAIQQWNHIAVARYGAIITIYVNGIASGTINFGALALTASTQINSIGRNGAGNFEYLNGYISNFRFVKGTALYTANFTPATSSLTTVANTSLLTLQNPTIQDNSPNNFTITRNGDTKIVPFGPFVSHTVTPDSYSYYFSGTSDYISTANANLAFGTSDFTVETWVYNRFGSNNGICQISNVQYGLSNTSTNTVALGLVNNKVVVRANNTIYTSTGTNVTANTWNHLALTRASNVAKLYINGTLDTTIGSSGSITDSTNYTGTNLAIGGYLTTSVLANAYISNFRTVKGTAFYTENFTVNTAPLTAVANTVVLTAQSNTIVDTASVNTFTGNGNTSPRVFNPFDSTTTKGVDYSPLEHGGSVYFDGTGDYLTIPSNPSLSLGGGSFTVECWVYISGAQTQNFGHSIVGTYPGSGNGWNLTINRSSTALGIQWINGSPSAILFTYGTYIPNNTWTHIAIVRSSTATNGIRAYVNGALVATGTDSTNDSVLQTLYIGAQGPSSCYFPGYISNLRILKGTALYTSNFVPPAAPPTPTANTSILMNFTNSGVVDSGYRSIIETVGTARMTNAIKKYNSGSYEFDGSGDYALTKSLGTDIFTFGTGDFTIEMWVRWSTVGESAFYDQRPTSTNGAYPTLRLNASLKLALTFNNVDRIIGTTTPVADQWYHVALARSGTSTKLFLDGVQEGSTYTDTNNWLSGANRPILGSPGFTIGSNWFHGYIDDLRITKGYARYTANFTPPSATFPDL